MRTNLTFEDLHQQYILWEQELINRGREEGINEGAKAFVQLNAIINASNKAGAPVDVIRYLNDSAYEKEIRRMYLPDDDQSDQK